MFKMGRGAAVCGLVLAGVLSVSITGCASQSQNGSDGAVTNAAGNAAGNLAESALDAANEAVGNVASRSGNEGNAVANGNEGSGNNKSLREELAEKSGTALDSDASGLVGSNATVGGK